MKDGTTYGGVVEVTPEKKDYSLMINDLKKVKLVILPRPYPTFLPYFFEDSSTQRESPSSLLCCSHCDVAVADDDSASSRFVLILAWGKLSQDWGFVARGLGVF